MKFNVYLTAFMKGEIREVNVPDKECDGNYYQTLEKIYYWGQNEHQPIKNRYSVSAGDVIEYYGGHLYMVLIAGFRKITREQLDEFKKMDFHGKQHFILT